MKVTLKVLNFTPDRDFYRKETITEPTIKKMTKKEQTKETGKGQELKAQLIEIKREEPVYEFPKDNIEEYLAIRSEGKLLGCLTMIRSYFDYKEPPEAGGVKGLKQPFNNAWRVRVVEVKDVGDIVPMGFVRRFQYKGQSGGMGCNRFDLLKEFTLVVEVTNLPVLKLAKNIFEQVIDYLPSAKLGRSGQIEIITKE